MSKTDAPRGGILKDWVLPAVVGLAVGLVILWGIDASRSDVQKVVDQWTWGDSELQEELAQELAALGESARPDLREAFLDVAEAYPELKVWVGVVLGGEPFYDTRFLAEQAEGGRTWDRRCAAVALVRLQGEKVDTARVMPGIVEWLEDLEVVAHDEPLRAVEILTGRNVLPEEFRVRVRDALIRLSDREVRPDGDRDDDEISIDRGEAAYRLGPFLPDEPVYAHLKKIALDTGEEGQVRVLAMRALAEHQALDDTELWITLGGDASPLIRQTAVDNAYRSRNPALNELYVPRHRDPEPLVRLGSVDGQMKRGQSTMFDLFDELAEDCDEEVRFSTLLSAAYFKDQLEGSGRRLGILVYVLEKSPGVRDVTAAVLALHNITGVVPHGFTVQDVAWPTREVDERAVRAFLVDPDLRAESAARLRDRLGPSAVWTDADRRGTLERMAQHPDLHNRDRAAAELARMDGREPPPPTAPPDEPDHEDE